MSLPDGRQITTLKVNELKKELEKRGLCKTGKKNELVKRLSTVSAEIIGKTCMTFYLFFKNFPKSEI